MRKHSGRGKHLGRGKGRRARTRGFLKPCLLLQLLESDYHGYDLLRGLDLFIEDSNEYDPSIIYRTLREMEEDGLVSSYEGETSKGPRRRVYTITTSGRDQLDYFARELFNTKEEILRFLSLYNQKVTTT